MKLHQYLAQEEWAVYRVNGPDRTYFGDTFFGPMTKKFPEDVEIPEGLMLDSLKAVDEYVEQLSKETA